MLVKLIDNLCHIPSIVYFKTKDEILSLLVSKVKY